MAKYVQRTQVRSSRAKDPAHDRGIQRIGDDSIEPWSSMGDWDVPALRLNGHPQPRVKWAYDRAWARAIHVGLPLADALQMAEKAAERAARGEELD